MFWSNYAGLEIWNAKTLEELQDRNFDHDMSESNRRRMHDVMTRLNRGEIVKELWTCYPSGLGACTLAMTISPIRIDGGRIASLVEAEVPDSGEIDQLSTRGLEMLRHLPLAVCKFDMQGNLVYQNPEASSVFGTPESVDRGSFLARFVDREVGRTMLEKVQAGNDYNVEAEHYTKHGPKWFNVSVRKSRDPVTADSIILYSARDISEVRQARKDSTEANLKSEFMAVMAHEIRTPLHQIIGYADLLELTQLSNDQLEHVKMIQNSTGLLMAIINDLLDYSKLEDGKLQLERICFDPKGVFNGCVAAFEKEAEEKGLALHGQLSDDLPAQLIGDPNRIRQILLNLLQNAFKFTETGSITIAVNQVKNETIDDSHMRLRCEVIDTGIGIDQSRQAIVFEKYQQAHVSVARNYGGTGLGLAICKSLSENMGGSIMLHSELGKGTTVIVEIPFELPPSEKVRVKAAFIEESPYLESFKRVKTEASSSSTEGNAEILGRRILVAEDNKVSQKLVRSMLQRMGYIVTIADNGQIAVDELGKADFDLVLMDVQMPVMDGIVATKQIRSLGSSKANIPVIGLTASYQHSNLQYYLDSGMNNCLGKPVRLNILKRAIETACSG